MGRARARGDDAVSDWVLVDQGTRPDGDNDALRRGLLAARPGLGGDASIEARFDIACTRDGAASLRIWQRPRSARPRRKPRAPSR